MEALTELAIALFAAGVLISLFTITRLASRSPATPDWLVNDPAAYLFAISFTVAVAASLFYLGFAFEPYLGVGMAGLATVGVHLGLLALFRLVLSINDEATRQGIVESRPANQKLNTESVAA